MSTRSRLWEFDGDDDAYRQFLEDTIVAAYAKQPFLFQLPIKRSLEKTSSPTSNDLEIQIWTPITTPKPTPKRPSKSNLSNSWSAVIKRIPQNEEQWQSTRQVHGLDTRENILLYLSKIRSCSWTHNADKIPGYSLSELGNRAVTLCREVTQLRGLSNLISFLFVAACCVDEAVGGDTPSTNAAIKSFFQALYGEEWSNGKKWSDESDNLRRIKKGAVRVIGMIDRLYDLIEHRAFELLIYLCMAPTTLRRLTDDEVDYTISLVSKQKVAKEVLAKEIQATEPLDVVYLLKLWRPHLTCELIGESLGTSLSHNRTVLPPSSLGKRRRDNSDDRIELRDSGRQYDPIRDTGDKGDLHADGDHAFDPSLYWANRLGSPSSCRSTSCFSDSRISNATDLTPVTTQGSSLMSLSPGISWTDEPYGNSRPLSAGHGPMLCPDEGMDEETRNLATCGLTKGSDYTENETLPSQSMNFEGDDDWMRAIGAGDITSNGPREEVWFQPEEQISIPSSER
ncbi:hypothetical protein EDB80DRAFT_685842 [Ilyonectria destructans]|nr:hypothetical protein EDB80DRAFT_685842 [Ilyonectria destructans]